VADYAPPYRELRERVTRLVEEHPDAVDTIAPATPEWRVRDVLAHLSGICDDILNGNMEGVATDDWTAAQVDARRDWSVERILDEWSERAPPVEQIMVDVPMPQFGQMVFDAVMHEHDIRGAIGEPGARDSSAVAAAFDWAEESWQFDDGTAVLVTEFGPTTLGAGERLFAVHAPRFELMRAMTGRRSAAQILAYEWEGTPRPERIVGAPIFQIRADDLLE
jgi:hypothetical protein